MKENYCWIIVIILVSWLGASYEYSQNIDHVKLGNALSNVSTTIIPTTTTFDEFHCNGSYIANKAHKTNSTCYSATDALQCFHDPIYCEKHFISGKRFLQEERPKYGVYTHLDHNKWIRIIQHGGIAFLYHPCASFEERDSLREVASSCLHRYVMTPYQKLSKEFPIALVSWGCYYLTSTVNPEHMKSWIRNHNHTYKGPASHVRTNGNYSANLIKTASVLTNVMDEILCPTEEEKNRFTFKPEITLHPKIANPAEEIIKRRLDDSFHRRDRAEVLISTNITLTKVEAGSAIWAAGSLIFLCTILVGLMFYTKLWTHEPSDYRYDRLDSMGEFEYDPGYSQFSLLKSSQKFMSMFRTKNKRERKLDSMSRVNLMMPITEEDYEEETMFQR